MSHELHFVNGVASFAYRGEKGWHSEGQEILPEDSLEVIAEKAGMTYTIKRAPVMFNNSEQMHIYGGKDVLYRDDDGHPVGLVSSGYKELQPKQVIDFFRGVDLPLETAGVLKHGSLYWAMVKLDDDGIAGGDKYRKYLLLSTSADGSQATDARYVVKRVVCKNTLQIAMRQGADTAVKTSHRTTFDPDAVKRALGLVDFKQSWADFELTMAKLREIQVNAVEASQYFADLLRPPKPATVPAGNADLGASTFADLLAGNATVRDAPAIVERGRAIRGLEDLEQSYYCAPGAVPGTAYGLVQGVTHYIDHVRGTSGDKRLTSAWFGQGAALKQTALDRALALAD